MEIKIVDVIAVKICGINGYLIKVTEVVKSLAINLKWKY
jgi:hypothetical protein